MPNFAVEQSANSHSPPRPVTAGVDMTADVKSYFQKHVRVRSLEFVTGHIWTPRAKGAGRSSPFRGRRP